MNRRDFLKLLGVGAAAAALPALGNPPASGLTPGLANSILDDSVLELSDRVTFELLDSLGTVLASGPISFRQSREGVISLDDEVQVPIFVTETGRAKSFRISRDGKWLLQGDCGPWYSHDAALKLDSCELAKEQHIILTSFDIRSDTPSVSSSLSPLLVVAAS